MPLNESAIDPAAALEASAVGGGESVREPRWSEDDADVIVSETSEFERADDNDIVYLADGETVQVTDEYFDIAGSVLVGGRHKPGVEPGTIDIRTSGPRSAAYRGAIRADSGGEWHLEGVRIDGPSWRPEMADGYRLLEQADVIDWPGYEPISRDGTTLSERDDMRSEVFSRGLNARVDGTVRNIEARGFTHAALSFGSRNHTPDVTVSRSMLHNCAVPGYGYGINLYNGTVTSELNYYDATRHAITGFGHPDCGYTCRGDLFGPNAMLTPIDMHNLDENGGEDGDLTAGKFLNTYECTFLARERFATPGWYSRSGCPAIGIRGHPAPGAPGYDTRDCQFVHFEEGDALDQRNVSFPTGWRRSGNEFGGLENWSEGKGAPVNWTGTSPAPSVDRTSGVEKRRASAQAGARCLGAVEAAMRAD